MTIGITTDRALCMICFIVQSRFSSFKCSVIFDLWNISPIIGACFTWNNDISLYIFRIVSESFKKRKRPKSFKLQPFLLWLRVRSGKRGIRTPGTVTRTLHFECSAFDHSAIFPRHIVRFSVANLLIISIGCAKFIKNFSKKFSYEIKCLILQCLL